MDPQQQQLLEQLKDVTLPANPAFWPPAIGWWVVLLLLLVVSALVYWLVKKTINNKQRNRWRKQAMAEHQRLYKAFKRGEDQQDVLAELSVLMRRVALVLEPRSSVASLTDDQWLGKLDVIGYTNQYTNGVGRLLYRQQYQRAGSIDGEGLDALFNLTSETISNASSVRERSLLKPSGGASVAAL